MDFSQVEDGLYLGMLCRHADLHSCFTLKVKSHLDRYPHYPDSAMEKVLFSHTCWLMCAVNLNVLFFR